MATVISFPRGGAALQQEREETDTEKALPRDWTIPTAIEMVRSYNKLSKERYSLKSRLARQATEQVERPDWKPVGAGYENLSLTVTRKVLLEKILCLGPEEMRLAVAYDRYMTAKAEWQARRKALTTSVRFDRLEAECGRLSHDYASAEDFLRSQGINTFHL